MNNRTPDASPFRQQPNHFRRNTDLGRSHSPESDVGYGTSFGSQDFSGGHNVDMDILSNLVVRYSKYLLTRPQKIFVFLNITEIA